MYTKQEASYLRQQFWTRFGQYMRPVTGANGETVNWVNYRTGIKGIFFRMDASRSTATIAIEIDHKQEEQQQQYYSQFQGLRMILEQETGETWDWVKQLTNAEGRTISRIGTRLEDVNVFNEADWPAVISFLKPRIIALDRFWNLVKEGFE
jgi:hypothetical protein